MNLSEGEYPRWKFEPVSTSRQRKRPQCYGNTADTIAPVADIVKKRKKSPALKPVIEKETGGENEGAHNACQPSSGGHFWSITVHAAKSLSDLLKPTVNDLCIILKFPVDVTNTVKKFLAFVLMNDNVIKEHELTLPAFMISLCWIGASLSKHKIGRSESIDLANKHLNFNCKEEEASSVYLKLEETKETFLKQTEKQEKHDALKDSKSPPQAICTESTKQKTSQESQHDQTVEKSESLEIAENPREEIEKFKREWDEKRVNLETDYKVEIAMITFAFHTNPSIRSEKLKSLDKEFANKLEEYERNKDIHLKELKSTLLTANVAADVAELPLCGSGDSKQGVESCDKPETSVTVGNPEGGGDKMTEMPMELDGDTVQDQSKERGSLGLGDEIESTCSHTSEKQMVDTTVDSSLPFVEIPPHQYDTVDDDVAGVVNGGSPGKQCDEIENNVSENVDSVELRIPEVDSNQENGNGDSSGADVAEYGEMGVPDGDDKKENAEDETMNSDKSQAGEEQNNSCGSSSSKQPSPGVPHDDTPSVQPIASQAPDDQMEQLLDLGFQEKEGEADPHSLVQINSEEPHDDPMAENQSDTHPANEVLPEITCENETNAPGTVNDQPSVEQHNSTQISEPPDTTTQNTSQPERNMFDLPNQVVTRIPNHGDPLQAEMERLFAYKDNVAKFYADMKLRLKSDCEMEIAEVIAQINLKYETKYKEAETAFELKNKELDTTINRVMMNKILAEAFRAECQDLTPSGPGMQKVTQAGLMQQLHRFSVRPSITAAASSSPGQSSGGQQTPPPPPPPPSPPPPPPPPPPSPPPPPPPPLQIVHQPAALFSSTVIRPSTTTNLRPPSTIPIRPPPTINPVTPTSRPPPNITPNTRPPPTITPVTPTTRPPPSITPLTPSAGSLRAPAPHLRPLVNSDIRAPAPLTPSAGSLRAPAPHLRPSINSVIRAPAPHMRPLVSSEIRAPAPHIRPFKPSTSASPELIPVHRRMLPGQHVTSPLNSQPLPLPLPLPPLPPEASYVPPPPPPSASSWQPSRSQSPKPPPPQHHQHPPLPRIPQIPTSQPGLFSTFPRPESGGTGYGFLDLTDIFPEDNARPSSGHDVICLSDDD